MNFQIRVPQIRLIASDGKQLGLYATDAAIRLAELESLDLVEIDGNAKPPVCKIMDYGKYKYQQQKKKHESKKHQVVVHLKEIKFRPNTDEHDIEFKVRHIRRFIEDKDKVKTSIQFRGREMQHANRAREIFDRIMKDTADIAEVEKPPKMEGRTLAMILQPK